MMDNHDLSGKKNNEENPEKKSNNKDKANICQQCGCASTRADHMRTHTKIHSGKKPNKCNQCDFASSWSSALKKHMKKQHKV